MFVDLKPFSNYDLGINIYYLFLVVYSLFYKTFADYSQLLDETFLLLSYIFNVRIESAFIILLYFESKLELVKLFFENSFSYYYFD